MKQFKVHDKCMDEKQSDSYHRLDREKVTWTESEKTKLINLYHRYGYLSKEIVQQLPGRSLHACRNMVRRLKEKNLLENFKKQTAEQQQCNVTQINPDQISNRYWTQEQEQKLLELAETLQFRWDQIAQKFKDCNGYQCFKRYKTLKKRKKYISEEKKIWTQIQKNTLLNLYEKYGNKWQEIASYLPGRTVFACRNTFSRIRDNKMPQQSDSLRTLQNKRKSLNEFRLSKINSNWTKAEDQRLILLAKQYKTDWNRICLSFQGYSAYNCYQRYKYIKSRRKRWALQDQNKLIQLYEKYHTQWAKIAQEFDNKKTKTSCSNKIKRLKLQNLKKQWSQQQIIQLIKQYETKKGNWDKIQKKFPNFTLRECFFKYYQEKQFQQENDKESKQQCPSKSGISNNQFILFDFQETWTRNVLKQLEMLIRAIDV